MAKNLGVIGYGWMGQLLARVASEDGRVRVAAIADPAGYSLKSAVGVGLGKSPQELGAELYETCGEMLEREQLDGVIIATPEHLHVDPVVQAAEAGCHIFLEKPMARTLDQADQIIAACRGNRCKLMIGYILRFEPAYIEIKRAVAGGNIGEFKSAYGRRNGTIDEARRLGGRTTVTNYIAVHDIDQILWYHPGVEVRSVYARAVRGRVQEELNTWDSSWATFQFRDGAVAVVETGWGLPENAWGDVKMYVTGTRGQCALDMVPMNLMVAGPQGWRFPITRLWTEVQGRMVGALQAEVAHFIDCLEFDRPPSVDGLDGRRSLEVAVAIERSIEQDCEIRLPLS